LPMVGERAQRLLGHRAHDVRPDQLRDVEHNVRPRAVGTIAFRFPLAFVVRLL
jgi:hypothetical protein